jgi:hypothetical protein
MTKPPGQGCQAEKRDQDDRGQDSQWPKPFVRTKMAAEIFVSIETI